MEVPTPPEVASTSAPLSSPESQAEPPSQLDDNTVVSSPSLSKLSSLVEADSSQEAVTSKPSESKGLSYNLDDQTAVIQEVVSIEPQDSVSVVDNTEGEASIPHSAPEGLGSFASEKLQGVQVQGHLPNMNHIRPDRGTVVEVLVAWGEKVISSHHFHGKGSVFIGTSEKCDVVVPFLKSSKSYRFLEISSSAKVCIDQGMSGEYIRDDLSRESFAKLMSKGRFEQISRGHSLEIFQGDMVRIGLEGDLLSIYVRYVPETPKPLAAPILDLSVSEVTGVIMAVVVSAVIGLYMVFYSPSKSDDEDRVEEPMRRAIVTFSPPKKQVVVVEEEAVPPPKKIVKIPEKKPEKKVKPKPNIPAPVKKKPVKKKSVVKTVKKKAKKVGKASEVKPQKKKPKKKPKKFTSSRSGGAIKTGKSGGSAKSEKIDPSKTGILGVFGSKGAQKNLDKVYGGKGELQGIADSATGRSGQLLDRSGENIGTRTKNTGAGGRGKSTVGISGVGTRGKGTGNFGQEVGSLGKKGAVDIDFGGQEEAFVGSLDRAAIRRVILKNKGAVKSCYNQELNRNKDAFGKLVLQWNIVEQGRVREAKVVSNSVGSQRMANCIIAKLKTWRFPEPPKNVEGQVTYPFTFLAK